MRFLEENLTIIDEYSSIFLLAFSKQALITVAPSLVADTDARLPRNEPIGVRVALTITTSYLKKR